MRAPDLFRARLGDGLGIIRLGVGRRPPVAMDVVQQGLCPSNSWTPYKPGSCRAPMKSHPRRGLNVDACPHIRI